MAISTNNEAKDGQNNPANNQTNPTNQQTYQKKIIYSLVGEDYKIFYKNCLNEYDHQTNINKNSSNNPLNQLKVAAKNPQATNQNSNTKFPELDSENKNVQEENTPALDDLINEFIKFKMKKNESKNNQEIKFPDDKLAKLDNMISKPRWIIPVLPKAELETILLASIDLAKQDLDLNYEPCQRFYREGLTTSFTKILCDEAVTGWKPEIHKCIFRNCKHLVELCSIKIASNDLDCLITILELLAILFNPNNRFHTHNEKEPAFPNDFLLDEDSGNVENDEDSNEIKKMIDDLTDEKSKIFQYTCKHPDRPKLWLVELIEDFGRYGSFEKIKMHLDNSIKSNSLNVALISALIRPFGLCYEYLTEQTVNLYFKEIIVQMPKLLENLSDNELKKESKLEYKNDQIASIIKSLKNLATRLDEPKKYLEQLEILRLENILKLLKVSSFNGKMNALNEINKVIGNVGSVGSVDFYPHIIPTVNPLSSINEERYMDSTSIAEWIKANQVLQIVLKDSLHQPQYVEKLEKIIRFIIKEKQLTLQDLDDLWSAQCGKHEAIVKNVHDLLAKLAWDFTPEQLDHLFECFQNSWTTASKKQREKLLELIRTLAEDDKDGLMAHKVLNLLWSLAHSNDLPTEIMDQALAAHIKILDYSCCQDRDQQKAEWLDRCILELTRDDSDPNWVIPALKQIREICCLYFISSSVQMVNVHQRMSNNNNVINRTDVITRLQSEHNLVEIVSKNLQAFMDKARESNKSDPNLDPNKIYDNNRYSHVQEIKERLSFLRFLLKEGHLWLCEPQAIQIWDCLITKSVYTEDREEAFSWFSQLMNEEPDLDPELNRVFFENQILKLDPILLTESGIECFDKFFKVVNLKENKLIFQNNQFYTTNLDLIGLDYLTRIVLHGIDEVSNAAIELLKAIYSNLSNCLQSNKLSIIKEFILSSMDRLKAFYDTILILEQSDDLNNEKQHKLIKMARFLKLLYEYLNQCDLNYGDERIYLPMLRSFRGKNITILIRMQTQNRTVEDVVIETHSNETLLNIKKQYLSKLKMLNNNMEVDFYLNGENLDQDINRDKKLVSHLTTKDHFILTARVSKSNFNSINDNEVFSQHSSLDNVNQFRFENGLNEEAENCLPSVYMSNYPSLYKSLFDFADLGLKLKYKPIYINSLEILKLMPIDKSRSDSLIQLCKLDANSQEISQLKEESFGKDSPTKLCYTLGVIYSLLMPANNPLSDEALGFQVNFIKSGIANEVQKFITKKDFLDKADDLTKVCAYSIVLKISKFVLKTIANYLVQSGLNKQNDQFKNLPKCLDYLQNTNEDFIICQASRKTAYAYALSNLTKQQKLNQFKVDNLIPDFEIISFVQHFIWSTASGKEALSHDQTIENLHQAILESKSDSESTIFNICKQGLEVLTIMLMLSPKVFLKLIEGKNWEAFTMDLILFSPEKSVRIAACEQFAFIATMCCSNENDVLKYYIKFLNQHLESTIPKNYKSSSEFFQLYCKLLNNAYLNKVHLPELKKYLHYEIDLLKNVKERLLVDGLIEEIQLEGHLCIIKELVMMLNSNEKYQIGCKLINEDLNLTDEPQFDGLLVMLIDEYIFTSSKLMVAQQKLAQRNILDNSINLINKNNSSSNSPYNSLSCIFSGDVDAICQNSATLEAAFDLIVALCIGCIPNLRYICDNLIEMFYLDHEITLTEWEYFPAIGCRPLKGFVGLKNGGATCYMNSIIQQLYMIPEIRDGILSVEGAIDDSQVEFYDDDTMNLPVLFSNSNNHDQQDDDNKVRKDYNVGVIKHLQAIFGHLTLNKLQYYTPKGFWCHFKLWGEPINLREQHDALEFFNSLVDSIDEGLKKLNYNKLMASVLGGSFADQKICKDCPHRYSREESFTTLNIDIRNHSNLLDSLEQYVKGDLLEGANAYHCEKCNRKVDTVKRLCIKKLPIILTIQLKRFDYDWERSCSIKFNDYFEFPRMLDMEPYTVDGLARIDGEMIEDIIEQEKIDLEVEFNDSGESVNSNVNTSNKDTTNQDQDIQCTKYELCGIVVHSGQASGGHYYSYILHKDTDGVKKWYKFDDGEVNECKLDQEEEMKNQCYGGDYLGEVFDHMLKRVSCRKQKSWWSAYILFYRRVDTEQCQFSLRLNELVLSNANINSNLMRASSSSALIKQNSGDSEQRKPIDTNPGEFYLRIPTPIRRSVQRQNIKFMHLRNQFNPEYFQFIKNLTSSNHDQLLNQYSNFLNNECKEDSLKESYSNDSSSSILKEDSKSSNDQLLARQQIETSLLCTKLLSKFLFTTCFHTKKSLRGSTIEWYEILTMHLRTSPMIRAWFAHNILIETPCRFSEYLLECISTDIRNVFAKLIMFISHYALLDGPNCQVEIEMDDGRDIVQCGQPLSDYIMQFVLDLLKKDTIERHMNQYYNQYFNLFYQYCTMSREARAQLIKLSLPTKFMNIALDENIIPSLKNQYSEFQRLHQVVSILVRSCDISNKCRPACSSEQILPNPYGFDNGHYICNLPADIAELLFSKQHYVKKVIEEATNLEETFLFLKYCCWENPRISKIVLEELIWHVAFYYDNELKPYLDLLLNVLLMQDSWQKIRIINALSGATQNEKGNILDAILRDKLKHQKRAYQCIKFLVTLFTNCEIGPLIIQNDHDISDKFIQAVNWLSEELDRHTISSNQYGYNWSSNENGNNYRLIRSNSARMTLAKAINFCPKEELFVKDKNTTGDKQTVKVEVKENESSESSQSVNQSDETVITVIDVRQTPEVDWKKALVIMNKAKEQEKDQEPEVTSSNKEDEQIDSPKKFFKSSEI